MHAAEDRGNAAGISPDLGAGDNPDPAGIRLDVNQADSSHKRSAEVRGGIPAVLILQLKAQMFQGMQLIYSLPTADNLVALESYIRQVVARAEERTGSF